MSAEPSLDPFLPAGHPVHTRTLGVEVFQEDADHVRAQGAVLDLRKCGFVPTGGDLQAAGFIHHMLLDGHVHQASRVLERLEVSQPVVAFEANATTGGESCRDPAGNLQKMLGTRLDQDFVRRLGQVFGGPLGCSHLLTLGQLMGSTLPRVLDHEEALARAGRGPREAVERLWRRALIVDGFEASEDEMVVAVQLTDVATAPHCEVERSPLDRFEAQHEVRVLARVDLANMSFRSLGAAERTRRREDLADLAFRDRSAELTELVGGSALGGLAKRLLERVGNDPQDRPFLDALLNLAPGLVQCLAALSHRLMAQVAAGKMERGSAVRTAGVGGFADSCYMWRRGSALARIRSQHPEKTRESGS